VHEKFDNNKEIFRSRISKKTNNTNNTMIKRQRQTIQWSKDKDKKYNGEKTKTNNTMVKRQNKQYNGEKTKQTIQ
jgi:hypothetical protein